MFFLLFAGAGRSGPGGGTGSPVVGGVGDVDDLAVVISDARGAGTEVLLHCVLLFVSFFIIRMFDHLARSLVAKSILDRVAIHSDKSICHCEERSLRRSNLTFF